MLVGVSLHQLQQLRIDLDVELGPGQRPQSAVPQAIGASLPSVNYVGEPAYLIDAAQTNVMTMDAGYWSENSVNACADQGVEAYVASGRLTHGPQSQEQEGIEDLRPAQSDCGTGERAVQGIPGLRRFLLRGLEKVNGEWHLIASTHNLLKLFRPRRSQQQERATTG